MPHDWRPCRPLKLHLQVDCLLSDKLLPDQSKIQTINQAGRFDQRLMLSTALPAKAWLRFQRNFLSYYFTHPPLWKILLRAALPAKRMVPAFASIGAVRSGTSLLADYIMQHPCVALPLAKEIGNSIPMKKLILAQFPTIRRAKSLTRRHGKAVTGYCNPTMPFLGFPYLARELAPNVKFIVILRDPVERTFAHWRWDQMRLSRITRDPLWARYPDFDESMRIELEAIRHKGGGLMTFSGMPGGGGYIQHSIYLPFIINLLKCFDRSNVLFVNSAEFFANPVAIARQVYSFLELPDYNPIEMPLKNAGAKSQMTEPTRQLLQDFFAPLNRELYDYIGKDMNW